MLLPLKFYYCIVIRSLRGYILYVNLIISNVSLAALCECRYILKILLMSFLTFSVYVGIMPECLTCVLIKI